MDVERQIPTATTATMEADEDLFFADLKDRIALLIMDDDDGGDDNNTCRKFPETFWPSLPFQALSYATARPFLAPPPYAYDYEAPFRREAAKGTGVFIPASTILPRKKSRSRQAGGKSRKAGGLDPPSADRLGSAHTPATCIGNASSLARKQRQQLPARKKGMPMC